METTQTNQLNVSLKFLDMMCTPEEYRRSGQDIQGCYWRYICSYVRISRYAWVWEIATWFLNCISSAPHESDLPLQRTALGETVWRPLNRLESICAIHRYSHIAPRNTRASPDRWSIGRAHRSVITRALHMQLAQTISVVDVQFTFSLAKSRWPIWGISSTTI